MIPIKDLNPVERLPFVTLTILMLCFGVFVFEKVLGAELAALVTAWGFIPARFFSDYASMSQYEISAATTTVSYIFLHGSWLHLLSNLLYLWIFADNVEDSMGHLSYILFFCACGIGAALTQGYFDPESLRPVIGASGAVSGILAAYLLRYPRVEISIVVPVFVIVDVVRLPAWVFIAAWFGLQLLLASYSQPGVGDIAFIAHVGGFVVGLVLAPLFLLRHFLADASGKARA